MNKIKNKKGTELTLNTIVMIILIIIAFMLIIFFFNKYYNSNSQSINSIGENAINMSKTYK